MSYNVVHHYLTTIHHHLNVYHNLFLKLQLGLGVCVLDLVSPKIIERDRSGKSSTSPNNTIICPSFMAMWTTACCPSNKTSYQVKATHLIKLKLLTPLLLKGSLSDNNRQWNFTLSRSICFQIICKLGAQINVSKTILQYNNACTKFQLTF